MLACCIYAGENEWILTIATDSIRFGQQKPILALPRWNFSMRKFREELRFLVVFEMRVSLGKIDLETTDSSNSANLLCTQLHHGEKHNS